MSQTGLIDAVTESAHILKGRLKNTPPPATAILQSDTDGRARQESWNYPSVIGQLNHLAQNSRPAISFAVHQCSRFSREHKALYEKALTRIIYYLQCTREKPLILKPNKKKFTGCILRQRFCWSMAPIICTFTRFMLITHRIYE
jgi:hypothetical protein